MARSGGETCVKPLPPLRRVAQPCSLGTRLAGWASSRLVAGRLSFESSTLSFRHFVLSYRFLPYIMFSRLWLAPKKPFPLSSFGVAQASGLVMSSLLLVSLTLSLQEPLSYPDPTSTPCVCPVMS